MTFPIRFARAAMAIAVPGAIAAPLAMVAAAAPAAAQEAADMAKFRAHLAGVQSMTANFVQTDGRGRSSAGTLQLKKPGRIRFQYGSGDLLLVANGGKLTFVDYQVGQKSSWALSKTPLGVPAVGQSQSEGSRHTPPERGSERRRRPRPRPRAIRHPDPRLPALALGARRADALRLDGDRRAEQEDDGQAQQPALQRRGARRRVQLRRAEEEGARQIRVAVRYLFIGASAGTA